MAAGIVHRGSMPLQAMMLTIGLLKRATPEVLSEYAISPSISLRAAIARFSFDADPEAGSQDVFSFWNEHDSELSSAADKFFSAGERFLEGCATGLAPLQVAVDEGILVMGGWSDQPPGVFENEQSYIDRAGNMILASIHRS
jgi:hypothetical protein